MAGGMLAIGEGPETKALLDLADRFGRTADDGVHVHHDLTQEELAQLVGASRETVNKALADFASRGWLRLEPRSVVIMDVERLTRRGDIGDDFWASVGLTRSFTDGIERVQERGRF